MYSKNDIFNSIDDKAKIYSLLSDAIWDYAEAAYNEVKSAEALMTELTKEGFEVTKNLADIHTAFKGVYGHGKPVIGILGEFDALANLSQEADNTSPTPIIAGGNGHGCGHNLLGVGALAAAVAVKEYLEKTNSEGTIVYFGCPAEEGGSGKAFMARDGVFDGVDIALTWHPGDVNAIMTTSTLANIQVSYKFTGLSAHAAAAPFLGRSALDAVELMNVGVNFLREHIIPDARIHYAITNSGGFNPNVVQPTAEVLYLMRAPQLRDADDIYKRVNDIARGAALMTGTTVDIKFIKACSNYIQNDTLNKLVYNNFIATQKPDYDEKEAKVSQSYINTFANKDALLANTKRMIAAIIGMDEMEKLSEQLGKPINEFILPYKKSSMVMPGSTDVGDVSWVCPTAQIGTVTLAAGTPGHSWQLVAQGKSSIAYKGMLYAAKILASSAIDLINDTSIIEAAKAEHKKRIGKPYACPIPLDVKPSALGCQM